ncbi:MAG TPA: DUF4271 domain-containing protein [Hymenobacter sp.]|uniref:DUF4271 domain-containing protein n=1 Tax=Hymenobacter sp. TaxID=1898978 RepID=UPI002D80CD48|nr:DUF4271 domain-containing protein [Hymenobacter sp.]HET9504853.1 DUF4271 domain-containing protein [Hymenobacter sp.]
MAAQRGGRWRCLLAILACLGWAGLAGAAEYRPLPPAPAPGLSADNWLLHDAARNRLILYLPGYHAPAHAYYQWLRLRPGQPLRVSFAAQPGLSIFLDNKLLLRAGKAGSYIVDLTQTLPRQAAGPHLLAVWQPDGYPALGSFTVVAPTPAADKAPADAPLASATPLPARLQVGALQSQSLLLGLLLVGLLYGAVRSAYPAGLASALQVSDVLGAKGNPQAFLMRPAFTLLNLVLVVLFSLSLALLLTALHTDFSSLPLVKQLLKVTEAATLAKISLYTGLILSFIIGKFLLVEGLSYIFDLRALATIHYREYLRTTLVMGLLVPIALFLFLSLNAYWPPIVSIANGFVLVLLTVTVLRVAQTLHQRASLLNLHLFAYLCATEILPLAVLLKLIVFTSPL